MVRRLLCVAALACAPAMVGCFVSGSASTEVVPAQSGGITLRWSIDGSFDPAVCDAFAVADARIDVYDAGGAPIQTTFVDCRAFSARINLPVGQYTARLQMVDGAKQPRSTSLPVRGFTIVAGTNLNQDTDFPRDSFY